MNSTKSNHSKQQNECILQDTNGNTISPEILDIYNYELLEPLGKGSFGIVFKIQFHARFSQQNLCII